VNANTERAYRADWADFVQWCAQARRRALPASPRTVSEYLDDLATRRRPSTVRRRLAALNAEHRAAGLRVPGDAPGPRLAAARADWRGRALRRSTVPLAVPDLVRMLEATPATLAGARDRAVLLLGYGAALRRTELVGLDLGDARLRRDGALALRLSRGPVMVPPGSQDALCAVRAWSAWADELRARGVRAGPAFRPVDRYGNVGSGRLSDKAVTGIVQRAARAARLPRPERFTGRSLRLGMVVTAAGLGATDLGIMAQTGHRSRRLVHSYTRDRQT
jgi:site-specific recombinase XerD